MSPVGLVPAKGIAGKPNSNCKLQTRLLVSEGAHIKRKSCNCLKEIKKKLTLFTGSRWMFDIRTDNFDFDLTWLDLSSYLDCTDEDQQQL
jgi:hypothetical protein